MDTHGFIPRDKEDLDFIYNLRKKSIAEIKTAIPHLLEWVQDMNWPQAPLIIDYLAPHLNEIELEIIDILNGNDRIWKYWILKSLVLDSDISPSENILYQVRRISSNPTPAEIEEEVDIIAGEILKKYDGILE